MKISIDKLYFLCNKYQWYTHLSNGWRLLSTSVREDIPNKIKESDYRIDEETGEVLSVKEMRKFDGDIEEPATAQMVTPNDDDEDLPPIDTKAFDLEALSVLDELFRDSMILG